MRAREESLLEEEEGSSQMRQVRQRQNPEKPSDLTSIRELLEEVLQDSHEGDLHASIKARIIYARIVCVVCT